MSNDCDLSGHSSHEMSDWFDPNLQTVDGLSSLEEGAIAVTYCKNCMKTIQRLVLKTESVPVDLVNLHLVFPCVVKDHNHELGYN